MLNKFIGYAEVAYTHVGLHNIPNIHRYIQIYTNHTQRNDSKSVNNIIIIIYM